MSKFIRGVFIGYPLSSLYFFRFSSYDARDYMGGRNAEERPSTYLRIGMEGVHHISMLDFLIRPCIREFFFVNNNIMQQSTNDDDDLHCL